MFRDTPPKDIEEFASFIPGQKASYKDRVSPFEAKRYFEKQVQQKKKMQEVQFQLLETTNNWKNKEYPRN